VYVPLQLGLPPLDAHRAAQQRLLRVRARVRVGVGVGVGVGVRVRVRFSE